MRMADDMYHRAGYTPALNLGLAKFVWNVFMNLHIAIPCNRDPSKKEVRKALGTTKIKGHGLVPLVMDE
jgi:hypothetical protein